MTRSKDRSRSGLVRLLRKLAWEIAGLKFLLRNLWYSRLLADIPNAEYEHVLIRGMRAAELPVVDELQRQLRNGKGCNWWRRLLYRVRGRRLIAVALDLEDRVLGFQMFYFRPIECSEGVIHSAFTGVMSAHQGRGIGTRIRVQAVRGFKEAGLSGVSMFIAEDNQNSMKSAERAGYRRFERRDGGHRILMLNRFDDLQRQTRKY